VTEVITAIAHVAEGNVGDAIEKVGDLAARAASHMNDAKIASAEQKLGELKIEAARNATNATVQAYGGAAHAVVEALAVLEAQRINVRSALGARRTAYGGLGEAAARTIPSARAPGREKIAAIFAAIPLVEVVVAKARAIRIAAAVPEGEPAAERGLGIAHAHNQPSATNFLRACDLLAGANQFGAAHETKWAARRDQLFKVKEATLGRRPGPEPVVSERLLPSCDREQM
jgi:hypothetical protein